MKYVGEIQHRYIAAAAANPHLVPQACTHAPVDGTYEYAVIDVRLDSVHCCASGFPIAACYLQHLHIGSLQCRFGGRQGVAILIEPFNGDVTFVAQSAGATVLVARIGQLALALFAIASA